MGTDDREGQPNNDDDQDHLVDVVPIAPFNFIIDDDSEREHCEGVDSFKGDNEFDWYWIKEGTTRSDNNNCLEKDAHTFADIHD